MTTDPTLALIELYTQAKTARDYLQNAREHLNAARAEARHVAIAMAEHKIGTEEAIAGHLGVTRRTVRRWIGRERP